MAFFAIFGVSGRFWTPFGAEKPTEEAIPGQSKGGQNAIFGVPDPFFWVLGPQNCNF